MCPPDHAHETIAGLPSNMHRGVSETASYIDALTVDANGRYTAPRESCVACYAIHNHATIDLLIKINNN
eukprot:6192707-Pleurochrysis_carterae.AAC.3